MRNKFGEWITDVAYKDKKILLLVGDIGFGIFDDFRKKHPTRFINCGIAEQNMIGVAAGLASRGYKPYVYTIIPFLIYRPFEFVRNLIFHQNLPVRLVGVGGGFSYDKLGYTHYAKEDINLIQNLSSSSIYAPYSPDNALKCFDKSLKLNKPSYTRLMKGGEEEIEAINRYSNYDKIIDYGNQFCIVTTGSIIKNAINVCNELNFTNRIKGCVKAVFNNKFDFKLYQNLKKYKKIIFYEESQYPGLLSEYTKRFIKSDTNIEMLYVENNKIINFNVRYEILNNLKLGEKELKKIILNGS